MGDPSELCWTACPFRQAPPAKSALLVALVLAVSIGAAVSFEGAGYGILAFALLSGSLSRYFLPTRYAIDEAGLSVSHMGVRRRVPWAAVRRTRIAPDGVFLSLSDRPDRFSSFRGCFLRFADNRDEVIRFVQSHVSHRPP